MDPICHSHFPSYFATHFPSLPPFGRGSRPRVFGVDAPPILATHFSGWIGMLTGGTIWLLKSPWPFLSLASVGLSSSDVGRSYMWPWSLRSWQRSVSGSREGWMGRGFRLEGGFGEHCVGAIVLQGSLKDTCCNHLKHGFFHQNTGTPPFTRQCSGVSCGYQRH